MDESNRKPVILIYSKLTNALEHNIQEMEEKLYKIKEDTSLQIPIFLYSYTMFEGAISTLITRFCNVFPEKIPKEVFAGVEKSDLISNSSNKETIDSIVEKFVMKVTYGNIEQWVKQINEILGISIKCNNKILTEISETRNCLTHNNGIINRKYVLKCENSKVEDIGKRIVLNEKYVKASILFLKTILEDIKAEIIKKYSKYNKEKLIRDTWNYLFETPLLEFDKVCEFEEEKFYFNVEYLEERFSSLASSEQLLLAIIIQQFSGSILDNLTKFRDLPMLVHMTEKEKIYYILDLFDNYPLLLQN